MPKILALNQLTRQLEKKKLLLVLDNCEQIIDACSSLAEHLLRACPGLHILATSREILSAPGESPLRVPTLRLPASSLAEKGYADLTELAEVESVRLFVERATQNLPEFQLTTGNAAAVARICIRLDGIPLALELAAARVRLLSVEQISARLDDAFRLLIGGSRSALPRHQTLNALIDWSYNLLSQEERNLLANLSVFAGGWTLEATEAVCDDDGKCDVLNILGQLVDKSLVTMRTDATGRPRYHLLETIRQFAHLKMSGSGNAAKMRDRHLDYFLKFGQIAEPHIHSQDQAIWFDILEQEMDNLRLALEWAASGRVQDGLVLVMSIARFWFVNVHLIEATIWLKRLLAADQVSTSDQKIGLDQCIVRGTALSLLGTLLVNQDLDSQSIPYLTEGVELFRDPAMGPKNQWRLAAALLKLAVATEDQVQSLAMRKESLSIYRQIGDDQGISAGLFSLSYFYFGQGKAGEAWIACEESLNIKRENGFIYQGGALHLLGFIALQQGDYASGRRLFTDALVFHRQFDPLAVVQCICDLARVDWLEGDYAEALKQCMLAMELNKKLRSGLDVYVTAFYAMILWASGDYLAAKKIALDAMLSKKESSTMLTIINPTSLSCLLGRICLSLVEFSEARTFLDRAAEIQSPYLANGRFDYFDLNNLLVAIALLAARMGRLDRAVQLFAAAQQGCPWAHHLIAPADRSEREAALVDLRSRLGEAGFADGWAQGSALGLAEALRLGREMLMGGKESL